MSEAITSEGLDNILITEALAQRSPHAPNLQTENQALHTLARQLAEQPQTMLKTLVTVAKDLCQAGTAGVSLLEMSPDGQEIFRWSAIAGALADYEGSITSRNFSPCGLCLDRQAPQMYAYPERYFTYFQQTKPTIVEGLVIPLMVANQPLGTIWIVSHDKARQFDPEDVRIMTSLADFTAAALQSMHLRQTAEAALQREQSARQTTESSLVERQQMAAALHENQTRMEMMLTNMPGMVYRYVPNVEGCSCFAFVSSGCRDLFEVEPETALQDANSIWNLIHPDDRPSFDASMRTAVEHFLPWDWSGRFITPSGQLKWVQGRSRAVSTPDNSAWDGFLFDVTERKQAEAALRASEEQFRNMADNAPVMVWVTDAIGCCTYLSQSWYDFTGQTEETGLGFGWLDAVHPEDTEASRAIFLTAIERHEAFRLEYRLRCKDGEYRWALDAASPWFDGDGQFKGFIGSVIDISDRKQIEAALKARNERLNLLSEVANDLLLNEEPKAFLARLFARVSTHLGLEVFLNYLLEADQQHLRLHAYGGISEEIATSADVLAVGQGVCGYACQHRQPVVVENASASDHPLAIPIQSIGIRAYASHPLIVGDRVLGTLALGARQRDRFTQDELDLMQVVTHQVAAALERSRLLTQLQMRAEALAQTNRVKDEFLAVLSHELRSPLNPILGWVQMMRRGKLDAAKTAQAWETIERNAKLQAQLVDDLLDVSRILQGKLSLNVGQVNLVATIQAAIETVQLAAHAKAIEIKTTLDPQILVALGDAARLQQVVWNLLSNAVKFTPAGGRVEVRLERVEREGERGKRENSTPSLPTPHAPAYAQMTVSDTGTGIHPHFLPYVFDYFRQADGATTRRFGGLGLGLAIVRQLVEAHGGRVWAESQGEGQGATFTVCLPIAPTQPTTISGSQRSENAFNLQGMQILVVDNEPDALEVAAFVLEQAGASVISANSAAAAFALFTQSQPDLLISDVGMPEQDGYMLMQQIRSLPPEQGGQVPAIALTAYAGDINYERAMTAGFQRHLAKPVEPEALVRAIADLMQSNQRP